MKLITVFPDVVKSPKLTADLENALALVAKSKLAMEDFMTDIENMVSELRKQNESIQFKFIKMWEQYCESNDVIVRDSFDLNNAQHFFEYNYSIRHILEIVYRAGIQEAIYEPFYRIVLTMERGSDVQWLYREKFYAHGLYGLLDEGAEQGFSEAPDEMAQMTIHIASTPYKNI